MQGQMDPRIPSLADQVYRQNKGGDRGNKGGRVNKGGNNGGKGRGSQAKQADGQQQTQGDAGKRQGSGRQAFNRRGKRAKKQ